MPSTRPTLTRDDARRFVAANGFGQHADTSTGRGSASPQTDRIGIELEWLAVSIDSPVRAVPFDLVRDVASATSLPGGSRVTFEPGGQVELSSPPRSLQLVCDAVQRDAEILGLALARAGVALIALGLEPGPGRDRAVRSPRYDAMEAFFDTNGSAGRTMMRSTASLQVNVDLGEGAEIERRWRAAHDLGPMLAAAFANSPFGTDGPSGSRSTRLDIWSDIDPGRTTPAGVDTTNGCADAWADYALAADVMLVRKDDTDHQAQLTPLAFGDWVEHGHRLGWPTIDDLEYHLTTLFPPVRPRGWLELRMLDALPTPAWRVASAVAAVLIQDPSLDAVVQSNVATDEGPRKIAIRDALADVPLGDAARSCFAAALEALPAAGADACTITATKDYIDHYVDRGRCPADDLLDQWQSSADPLPQAENSGERGWN